MPTRRPRPSTAPIGRRPVIGHGPRLARYRAVVAGWSWHEEYADAVAHGPTSIGSLVLLPSKPRGTVEPGNYAWPSADLLRVLRDAFRAAGSDPDDLPAIAEAVSERFPDEDNAAEIADFPRVTASERLRQSPR